MKLIIPAITLLIACSNQVVATENNQDNYLEISRVVLTSDEMSDDFKGFGIESKYSINTNMYLNTTYQNYGVSDTDIDRIKVGVGGEYAVNEYVSPLGQLDYVYVDSKSNNFSAVIKYWIIGIGISGSIDNLTYKAGISRYQAISAEIESDTGHFAEVFYSFSNNLSAGFKVESADESDMRHISVRYNY